MSIATKVNEDAKRCGFNAALYSTNELAQYITGTRIDLSNAQLFRVISTGEVPAEITRIQKRKLIALHDIFKRMAIYRTRKVKQVSCSDDAANALRPILADRNTEGFFVMTLDTHNNVLEIKQLTSGTLAVSVAHPRDVFRTASLDNADSVILAHNHPSGDPAPSRQDISMTRNMVQAGKIMHIEVLDHIIIGGDDYVSMKNEGYID